MIEVEIADEAWLDTLSDAEARALVAAQAALLACRREGDAAILLAGDDVLADLNQRFRGKTGPTNVLSFPAPPGAGEHLGDIAIAYGICVREACEQGKRLEHHLMHLVVHGVLHLVGYDHETESEAEDMEALERRVLADLGAPDPYRTAHDEPHAR